VSHVGFLAEEPDCDARNDADEASLKADDADFLLVHFTISSFAETPLGILFQGEILRFYQPYIMSWIQFRLYPINVF